MWMYSFRKFQTKFIQGHGHGYHMVSLFDNQLPGSWVLHPTNHSAPAGIACSVDPNQKSGLSCLGVLSTWVHLCNNKQSSILNSSQSGCRYISMYVHMSMWHVSIFCIPCDWSLALKYLHTRFCNSRNYLDHLLQQGTGPFETVGCWLKTLLRPCEGEVGTGQPCARIPVRKSDRGSLDWKPNCLHLVSSRALHTTGCQQGGGWRKGS